MTDKKKDDGGFGISFDVSLYATIAICFAAACAYAIWW